MLLRRLLVVTAPLMLCLVVCTVFHWLDSALGATSFFSYLLKGIVLGFGMALLLPCAGIKTFTSGLVWWMFVSMGILALLLIVQYLQSINVLTLSFLPLNGQIVLVQSTVLGFVSGTTVFNRH